METVLITRKTVLELFISRLRDSSDDELISMLESFPESEKREYVIVTYNELEAARAVKGNKTIKSISEFKRPI